MVNDYLLFTSCSAFLIGTCPVPSDCHFLFQTSSARLSACDQLCVAGMSSLCPADRFEIVLPCQLFEDLVNHSEWRSLGRSQKYRDESLVQTSSELQVKGLLASIPTSAHHASARNCSIEIVFVPKSCYLTKSFYLEFVWMTVSSSYWLVSFHLAVRRVDHYRSEGRCSSLMSSVLNAGGVSVSAMLLVLDLPGSF